MGVDGVGGQVLADGHLVLLAEVVAEVAASLPCTARPSCARTPRKRRCRAAGPCRAGAPRGSCCGHTRCGCRGSCPGFSQKCPRSSKRTPTEVTPRRPIPDLPIIGLPALLSLVEWIEGRRIKSQQGGPSCDDLRANVSPPAPDRVEGATTTGPALAGSDRRPAAANAPGAQPRRGSSTGGTSGRKGGGA